MISNASDTHPGNKVEIYGGSRFTNEVSPCGQLKGLHIDKFEMENITLDDVETGAFAGLVIKNLRITNSNIRILQTEAFSNLTLTSLFQFEGNTVDEVQEKAFDGIKVGSGGNSEGKIFSIEIVQNQFHEFSTTSFDIQVTKGHGGADLVSSVLFDENRASIDCSCSSLIDHQQGVMLGYFRPDVTKFQCRNGTFPKLEANVEMKEGEAHVHQKAPYWCQLAGDVCTGDGSLGNITHQHPCEVSLENERMNCNFEELKMNKLTQPVSDSLFLA